MFIPLTSVSGALTVSWGLGATAGVCVSSVWSASSFPKGPCHIEDPIPPGLDEARACRTVSLHLVQAGLLPLPPWKKSYSSKIQNCMSLPTLITFRSCTSPMECQIPYVAKGSQAWSQTISLTSFPSICFPSHHVSVLCLSTLCSFRPLFFSAHAVP